MMMARRSFLLPSTFKGSNKWRDRFLERNVGIPSTYRPPPVNVRKRHGGQLITVLVEPSKRLYQRLYIINRYDAS